MASALDMEVAQMSILFDTIAQTVSLLAYTDPVCA